MPGQSDAQPVATSASASAPYDERHLVEHPRVGHLVVEVVALAGALTNAGEHRRCRSARWRSCRDELHQSVAVLPRPAPPNSPILPALLKGRMRSMTLMPGRPESRPADGLVDRSPGPCDRWPMRSCSTRPSPPRASGVPSTSMMRPKVIGPSGTEISAPVLSTPTPRCRRVAVDAHRRRRARPRPSICGRTRPCVRPVSSLSAS